MATIKGPSSNESILTDTQNLGLQDCEPQRRGPLTQVERGVKPQKVDEMV